MAPKKKSKKPVSNPARGFATTSIASKPRVAEAAPSSASTPAQSRSFNNNNKTADTDAPPKNDVPPSNSAKGATPAQNTLTAKALSPEEFEKQLEESELQLLVEKYGQTVRRLAQRQKSRLETDRRILRNGADTVNPKKWLPTELMDQILELIQAENRFAASGIVSDGATSRLPPEEDLIIKLWTLQLTLQAAGMPSNRIQPALQYVLDIAPNISLNVKGESIWGLEEVLDWFARECSLEELPDYSGRKTGSKSQAGRDLVPLFMRFSMSGPGKLYSDCRSRYSSRYSRCFKRRHSIRD